MKTRTIFVALLITFLHRATALASTDGLDEVNAVRAARGLRRFVRDNDLTRAAAGCADFRAER